MATPAQAKREISRSRRASLCRRATRFATSRAKENRRKGDHVEREARQRRGGFDQARRLLIRRRTPMTLEGLAAFQCQASSIAQFNAARMPWLRGPTCDSLSLRCVAVGRLDAQQAPHEKILLAALAVGASHPMPTAG